NGPDSFPVAAASARGWPVTLYRDWNGDGLLDAGDSLLTGPVPLGYGATASLIAQVAVPAGASPGVSDTITVTATSRFNPAVSSSVQDRLDVSASGAVTIGLTKQVDRLTAVAADVLTYTLAYAASGSGTDSSVTLADTVPAGASYVAGSMRWNGTPLTDATGDDAGSFVAAGNGVVVVTVGSVAGGTRGAVTVQARVASGRARGISAPGASGVVDLVRQGSITVQDTAWAGHVAGLTVTKATPQSASAPPVALIGPRTAAIGLDLTADALEVGSGEVIPYTEVVRNPGIVPISAMRIDNTLPAGGSYARGTAIGADSVLVAGGHLILVTTAPLAPGATRTLHYAVALASASGTMVEVRAIASARAGALQPVSPQAVAWVQVRRAWPMET